MRNETYEEVTEVTFAAGKPTWNYTRAVEPVTPKRQPPTPDMISSPAIHKYVIVIFAFAMGIALVASTRPDAEILCALALGWLVGQLWRWEPPR